MYWQHLLGPKFCTYYGGCFYCVLHSEGLLREVSSTEYVNAIIKDNSWENYTAITHWDRTHLHDIAYIFAKYGHLDKYTNKISIHKKCQVLNVQSSLVMVIYVCFTTN